jgi:hypothetical protein
MSYSTLSLLSICDEKSRVLNGEHAVVKELLPLIILTEWCYNAAKTASQPNQSLNPFDARKESELK